MNVVGGYVFRWTEYALVPLLPLSAATLREVPKRNKPLFQDLIKLVNHLVQNGYESGIRIVLL